MTITSRKKVFGVGLPKTGTKTLGECLRELGFKHRSYDMDLAAQAKRNEVENALAEAARYESFEDWPWFLLYRELDHRFPHSKFILTLRKNPETYIRSLWQHHERQRIRRADFVKPHWWDDVFGFPPEQWDYEKSVHRYENHRRAVLEYFEGRADDFLVVCWEAGDGWEELCRFLNLPCPDAPFPHANDHRQSRPQIVLRGVIEYKPSSRNLGAVTILLKLSTPICVRGVARDGLPFKKENIESIVLGLPAKLMGTLQPLDRVALRGELWGPAVNEEALDNVMFAVKEVL